MCNAITLRDFVNVIHRYAYVHIDTLRDTMIFMIRAVVMQDGTRRRTECVLASLQEKEHPVKQ
jgi:hypothetical protein